MSGRITAEFVPSNAIIFRGTGSGPAGRRISRCTDVLPLTVTEVEARKQKGPLPSYAVAFLNQEPDGGGVMGFVSK